MDKASFALSLFVVAFQDEIKQVAQKIATETDVPTRQLLQQQLEQAQSNQKRALARHAQLCQVQKRGPRSVHSESPMQMHPEAR